MNKFWLETSMEQMSSTQWESLCDGCGKCCRMQFIGEDEEVLMQTDVVCHLLDQHSLQCSDYSNRTTLVPDCVQITPDNIKEFYWLPDSCGYRCIAAGKDLPEWHHLNSGSRETIHQTSNSVRGKVVGEHELEEGEEIDDRIISWLPLVD